MSWRKRLERLVEAVTEQPIVRRVLATMNVINEAGGPLLAAALAFGTMFAIVPVLLLLSGMLGWIVEDLPTRTNLLRQLVALMPPLADAFSQSLEGALKARGALTVVGLIGLLWGASSFYASLDEVMRRLFGGPPRGFIEQRVRGVLTVIVLVAVVIAVVSLSGLFAVVESTVGQFVAWRWVGFGLAMLVTIGLVLAVYRLVPSDAPRVREALPPAILGGLGIGLLTSAFSALAPLLIGGLAGFGILATIFGALVWLNLCYQVLLWGAAWARVRRDRAALAGGPLPGQN
jgi:YihY family inner membrane protein